MNDERPLRKVRVELDELCAAMDDASLARSKKVARRDPVLGAEGAVLLLERISAALENVDSSSGAIVDLLSGDEIWPYKRWAVKALAAMGRKSDAIRYAESCRGPWTNDNDVNRMCEAILLSSGFVDEAYRRYGLLANRTGTYVGTFRAVAKKYPHKSGREILHDLIRTTPGEEGKCRRRQGGGSLR